MLHRRGNAQSNVSANKLENDEKIFQASGGPKASSNPGLLPGSLSRRTFPGRPGAAFLGSVHVSARTGPATGWPGGGYCGGSGLIQPAAGAPHHPPSPPPLHLRALRRSASLTPGRGRSWAESREAAWQAASLSLPRVLLRPSVSASSSPAPVRPASAPPPRAPRPRPRPR